MIKNLLEERLELEQAKVVINSTTTQEPQLSFASQIVDLMIILRFHLEAIDPS